MGLAFAYALPFHQKGLLATEEGLILAEAESILAGRVLYRDIDCFVTPGVWYLAAGVLGISGHSLNATRLVAAGLFALSVGLVFAITARVASRRAALAACGVLAVLKVLAFPLGNFLWYTELSVGFALLAVYALLRFEWDARRAWLAAAGAAVALSLLSKQNLGGVLAVALAGFLLAFHRERRSLAAFAAPLVGLGALTLLYFALHGALGDLLRSLVGVPLTRYGGMSVSYFGAFALRSLETADGYAYWPNLFWEERFLEPDWGAGWEPVARGIAVSVYAAPLLLSAWVIGRALRRRRLDRSELLLWLAALAIYQSAFPRSDFAHVAQTLPGFVPLAALLAARSQRRRWLWAVGIPAGAVVVAFCAVLFANAPYRFRLEHPKARVDLSEPVHQALQTTLQWIESSVPPGAPMAVMPSGPIYYFLADRPVPFRYTVLLPPNVPDEGRDAARLLEELGIDHVILGTSEMPGMPPFASYAPVLSRYLGEHYRPLVSRRFRRSPTMQILVRNDAG